MAKAELAGKICKCSCGAKIQVPSKRESGVVQASIANPVDMSAPLALPVMAEAAPQSGSKFQTRYNNPEAYKSATPPPKKKVSMPKRVPSRNRSASSGSNHSALFDGPVIGGVGMMLGATIWFVVGWWAGYIFYYPPILFCLGFGSVIKGLID